VKLQTVDQALGPLSPLVRTRQYSVPRGRLMMGVYVDGTTVAFTTKLVKVAFFETWMV